ncbi:MAG: hypothetical protein NZM36_03650 [Aquificaceae bacterium]|nr:hypothetical protein [Aquificaceae bacterium]
MKAEKFWLYFSLYFLITVGFSVVNLVVFLETKKLEEEYLKALAYQHFKQHLLDPNYKGDGKFIIEPSSELGYIVFSFEEPGNPIKRVRVAIKEEDFQEGGKSLIKKLFFIEVVLIFTLVFLYQAVVESYIRRLKDKEDWIKRLMLFLTHRLGNFLAAQKVLFALLEKSYPRDENLKRMGKSLKRAQRDFNIITILVKEDKPPKPENVNLKDSVLDALKYFEEELSKKQTFLSLKDMWVRMDRMELEDVLYNLVGNAVKHSKSLVHIKLCPKKNLLVISNDISRVGSQGMGMGVELTRMVLDRYGHSMTVRLKRRYTLFLNFKGRG